MKSYRDHLRLPPVANGLRDLHELFNKNSFEMAARQNRERDALEKSGRVYLQYLPPACSVPL